MQPAAEPAAIRRESHAMDAAGVLGLFVGPASAGRYRREAMLRYVWMRLDATLPPLPRIAFGDDVRLKPDPRQERAFSGWRLAGVRAHRYFNPVPVLNTTTRSFGPMNLLSRSL
jgi:hypothetical protein